ncbi:hypothetical protein [Actinophytocola sp.]|uniref:hypothetical protein n=1 Tax=Actinophytocola sp. TaxID=1872138 RepID=UPI002ED226FB
MSASDLRTMRAFAATAGIELPDVEAEDAARRWEPFRQEAFVDEAGKISTFDMRVDPVEDDERTRVLATHPDGKPMMQEFDGKLVIRFTNGSNGKSVLRNVTSYAMVYTTADGVRYTYYRGRAGVGVRIGNPTTPSGWYIMDGTFFVRATPAKQRDFLVQDGSMEDLCETLA